MDEVIKANAPNKIYVQMSRYWYGIDSLFYSVRQHKNDTEYIRTDAFIEKAKKWFEQQPETYDANGIRCYGMEDFEDFRKYFIDSLQEEPVSRTSSDVESAMQEVEEKSRAFTEAHKGESSDEILAQMRDEEPVSEELEEAAWLYYDKNRLPIPPEWNLHKEFIDFFKAGAKWKKKQMLKNAISAELYSDGMFTPLIGVKDKEKLDDIKFGDKVKLIIIKDE